MQNVFKSMASLNFRIDDKRLRGAALALVLTACIGHAQAGWEASTDITSTPLHEGVPLQAQFRYHLINLHPAGRMRDIRLKGAGLFSSYSTEELAAVGNRLLAKLDNMEAARLPSNRPGRAVYFANERYFLVSARPALLAIVPHEFMPAGSAYTTATLHQLNPQSRYNKLFEKQRTEDGLRYYMATMETPYWVNYLELSAVVPDTPGIRVIGDWWDSPVTVEMAQADPRWPFRLGPATRFPGYLEFTPKAGAQR